MSAYFPPSPYFSNIDYNNTFFTSGLSNYLTLNYANSHYLYSYGIATSTASITQFNGSVGIGAAANGINGNLSITSLNVSSNAGIGTAINSSYTLNTNTLNAVTSISINGQLLNTLFQPVINTYIVSGGSGGSMNYSSGTLTLTLPLSYSSMSINSLTTATSFIYQGTELATTLLNYTTTAQMNTAISTALVPYSTTTQMNTAISTALVPYSTTTQMNTAISSAVSSYLPLSGGTMTGTLSLTTSTTDNQIVISNSSSAHYSTIRFSNNISSLGYIGIGGTNVTGNFANNFFIQSPNSIVFNTNGNATASTPNLLITSSGNVGINTASASSTLTVNGNTTTSNLNVYGVATFQTNNWITSSDTKNRIYFQNNDITYFQSPNGYSLRDENGNSALYINNNLNVGINTTGNTTLTLLVNGTFGTTNSVGIGTTSGFSSFFNVYGTSYLNGNVGIGTTNASGSKLEVYGTTYLNGLVGIGTTATTNADLFVYGLKGIQHTSPTSPSLSTSDSNVFSANTMYGQFAGDMNLYSYWGISLNLNNGGNNPSGNAGNARIPYTSSFTINQKANGGTATSGFTNLFTVLQNGNVGIGTTNPSTLLYVNGATTINSTLNTSQFYTTTANNIITNVIGILPQYTTGGPYGNGFWLIDVSKYTSQNGFSYLFLNLSQPIVPIFWQGRVVISSGGSMSTYADVGYNVQLAYYTTGGYYIQISSPSGVGFSYLYYKIIG